jgi:hypothetical protein
LWLAGDITGSSGATIVNSPSTAEFKLAFSAPTTFVNGGGQAPVFVNNASVECNSSAKGDLQLNFHNERDASMHVSSGWLYLSGSLFLSRTREASCCVHGHTLT